VATEDILTKVEKLLKRLLSLPTDFTYREAKALLEAYGFIEQQKGRTSGSRVSFYRANDKKTVLLHKSHPGQIMRMGAVKQLADFIKDERG
jgi:hypothetical protein